MDIVPERQTKKTCISADLFLFTGAADRKSHALHFHREPAPYGVPLARDGDPRSMGEPFPHPPLPITPIPQKSKLKCAIIIS